MKYILLPIFRFLYILLYVVCYLTVISVIYDLIVILFTFLWEFNYKKIKENLKCTISLPQAYSKFSFPFTHRNFNGEDHWSFFMKNDIEYKSWFCAIWNIQPKIIECKIIQK